MLSYDCQYVSVRNRTITKCLIKRCKGNKIIQKEIRFDILTFYFYIQKTQRTGTLGTNSLGLDNMYRHHLIALLHYHLVEEEPRRIAYAVMP